MPFANAFSKPVLIGRKASVCPRIRAIYSFPRHQCKKPNSAKAFDRVTDKLENAWRYSDLPRIESEMFLGESCSVG